jgi:hypothetical protein
MVTLKTDRMAEAEVALRLADYLLELSGAEQSVEVAVDGASVKVKGKLIFRIGAFLKGQGWQQIGQSGKNEWTGTYERHGQKLRIHSKPGRGDVVIRIGTRRIIAECKKGPLVKKKGSQERRNLTEALGQALLWPAQLNDVVVVAVPDTESFRLLAEEWRARPLVTKAGIQICLVNSTGKVSGLHL